jgi:hypothetical protein
MLKKKKENKPSPSSALMMETEMVPETSGILAN